MSLQCALLSEGRPFVKASWSLIPTLGHSGRGKTRETIKESMVARAWGGHGRDE